MAPYPVPGPLSGPLVLASGSPRRRELLGRLGIPFDVVTADVDETPGAGESPSELVDRLAAAKAVAVSRQRPGAVVIGADTVVAVDGEILGKPADADDARRMLQTLSGRWHDVHTGIALAVDGAVAAGAVVRTAVRFAELTDAEICWYVATGEPLDKAGAYALQGAGGALVAAVAGSPSNVVGLPLAELAACLRQYAVS